MSRWQGLCNKSKVYIKVRMLAEIGLDSCVPNNLDGYLLNPSYLVINITTNAMSDLQPLVLYAFAPFAASANPWKVAFILEELDIPYRFEKIQTEETKQQVFLKMNPNGKVPVLRDPNNNNITIWEVS
jgi:hypothetical protein